MGRRKAPKDRRRDCQELKGIVNSIKGHQGAISEHQKKITNIELSIENINRQISSLGLEGFEIQKEPDGSSFYRLMRGDRYRDVYITLSEGEKTLITFLYFMELCKGTHDSETPVNHNNRIVVIDDPISSLSHNYVYDVASMIYHQAIKKSPYRQLFVLTHSLFFFHELIRLESTKGDCPKTYKLFRITKNKNSQVLEMNPGDIQNDYQFYWQVVRDALNGQGNSIVLPNMMRNILEYYFAFVHKQDKLKQALEDLSKEDSDFKPLYRYINRESHSDAINLTDFGAFDPTRFVEKFRAVFKRTGFEEHFHKMMGVGKNFE